MWKTILEKIQSGILAYWSQVTWFVLGVLLGTMLLGGLVSCTSAEQSGSSALTAQDRLAIPYARNAE